jgi:acetyl esterase
MHAYSKRPAPLVEYLDVHGVDHGYNILGDDTEITRRMYDFIAGHVARATANG